MAKNQLFPELKEIISTIDRDERQDIVILIVPSHSRNDKPLRDQEIWAGIAMDLFADLYGGATAFKTFQGIDKDAEGKVYRDKPILIESYVARDKLLDESVLRRLLEFAQRMGRETRQKAVALIINNVFHEITKF